jgi:hypothetical protein
MLCLTCKAAIRVNKKSLMLQAGIQHYAAFNIVGNDIPFLNLSSTSRGNPIGINRSEIPGAITPCYQHKSSNITHNCIPD